MNTASTSNGMHLERRFQPVMVGEPTVDETIEILYGLRERYEQHHKLKITDEALFAAAKLLTAISAIAICRIRQLTY